MLYSSVIVAASAFASFAAAQNSTTVIPCCTVAASTISANDRSDMCNANENTCVELCGGLGNIASNGNNCDDTTLVNSCKCSNGTDISSNLSKYQQSVSGQMCQIYWYQACISASGSDAAAQRNCVTTRESKCGNLTVDASSSSSSSSAASSASRTSAASGATSATGAAATTTAAGMAAGMATFGTPTLVGGLLAIFGFVL